MIVADKVQPSSEGREPGSPKTVAFVVGCDVVALEDEAVEFVEPGQDFKAELAACLG